MSPPTARRGRSSARERKTTLLLLDDDHVVVVVRQRPLAVLVRLLPQAPLVGRPVPLVERLDLGPRAGGERVVQQLLDRAEYLLDRDRRRPLAVPRPVGLVEQIEADAPATPDVQVPEDLACACEISSRRRGDGVEEASRRRRRVKADTGTGPAATRT